MSDDTAADVRTELAVISTKLDILIEAGRDHEGRIRTLEQFRWALMGACIAGGGAAGAVVSRIAG